MHDRTTGTRIDGERKGFASRAGFGCKPALLVIGFIDGFTDPGIDLGGDFTNEIEAAAHLQAAFRTARRPVAHTVVARDAVGDRAAGPHEANLFDVDARYGDVGESREVLARLAGAGAGERFAPERAADDFQRRQGSAGQEAAAR